LIDCVELGGGDEGDVVMGEFCQWETFNASCRSDQVTVTGKRFMVFKYFNEDTFMLLLFLNVFIYMVKTFTCRPM